MHSSFSAVHSGPSCALSTAFSKGKNSMTVHYTMPGHIKPTHLIGMGGCGNQSAPCRLLVPVYWC